VVLKRREEVAEKTPDSELVATLETELKQVVVLVLLQLVNGSFHRVRLKVKALFSSRGEDIGDVHHVLRHSRLKDFEAAREALQIEDDSKVVEWLVADLGVAVKGL